MEKNVWYSVTSIAPPIDRWVIVGYAGNCGLNVQMAKLTEDGKWIYPAFTGHGPNVKADAPSHWMVLPKAPQPKHDSAEELLEEIVEAYFSGSGGASKLHELMMDAKNYDYIK